MASYKDYMYYDKLPHTWCSGCGHGIILQAIADTFASLNLDKHKIVLVSGIGCFGRVDDYLDINCMHVTHGRALPAATGVALANPELTVLVTMGDGDGATIGGNHLIHAARRNVNLTAIIANNLNYGQTGGQYSSTTPYSSITSTSPYGHIEDGFDLCNLVAAAGASFAARAIVYNPMHIRRLLEQAIETKGFSLLEVMSTCPTRYGHFNKQGNAAAMMESLNKSSITIEKAATIAKEELKDKVITGVICRSPKDDYYTRYMRVVDSQMNGG